MFAMAEGVPTPWLNEPWGSTTSTARWLVSLVVFLYVSVEALSLSSVGPEFQLMFSAPQLSIVQQTLGLCGACTLASIILFIWGGGCRRLSELIQLRTASVVALIILHLLFMLCLSTSVDRTEADVRCAILVFVVLLSALPPPHPSLCPALSFCSTTRTRCCTCSTTRTRCCCRLLTVLATPTPDAWCSARPRSLLRARARRPGSAVWDVAVPDGWQGHHAASGRLPRIAPHRRDGSHHITARPVLRGSVGSLSHHRRHVRVRRGDIGRRYHAS